MRKRAKRHVKEPASVSFANVYGMKGFFAGGGAILS